MDQASVSLPLPGRWWALIGASLAVFMSALDSTVVNVALPVMASAFHVTNEIRWVSLAYLLPTTALLGTFGALSDAVGRKRITLIGIGVFVLGSALCGMAQTLWQMIFFRILQGVGGACIGSAIIAIATVNFGVEERGKAMSIVGLIAPLGAVAGPSLGGFILGAFGWPAIFYVNVPFGILSFLIILRLLPAEARGRARAFDARGAVLFTVALLLLLLGLSPIAGRLTRTDLILLAGFVVVAGVLAAVERRAANALLPPALVRRGSFSLPLGGLMASTISMAGLAFVLPFFLEETMKLSPQRAGLTLLFFPLAMAAASQIAGRLTDRYGPKLPAAVGAGLALVGLALMIPLDRTWSIPALAVRLAIGGLGTGFFITPSTVAIMAATPRDHVGVGSAMVNTFRYLGFALGPALVSLFWSPGMIGAVNHTAQQVVLIFLCAIQAVALASVLSYRVERAGRGARPALETPEESVDTGLSA